MKKLLLVLTVGSLVCATACKKQESGSEEKFPVQFSLSTFSQTITDLKSKIVSQTLGDTLSNQISHLHCRIYSASDGKIVYSEDQTEANPAFGRISSVLSMGNYSAVFVGSKSASSLNSASPITVSAGTMQVDPNSPTPDIFVKKLSFSVTNTPLVQAIRLNRIVAGLNVIIEDEIPASVKRIEIVVPEEHSIYSFSDSSRSGVVSKTVSFPISPSEVGVKNKTLNCYALRISSLNNKVIVKAYSDANLMLFEKTIPNAPFYVNRITSLRGKLFSNQVTLFSVSTNPVWDTPAPIVLF